LLILAVLGGAACHDDSGVAVKSLGFEGNAAFDDGQLEDVVATRESGWLPWGEKHFFDREEFETDARRLQAFYADRGYPDMRIVGVDVNLHDGNQAVDLTVQIEEGEPVRVAAVRFEGFEPLPEDARARLDDAAIPVGAPRDQAAIRSTRDMAARLMRDHGYPHATVHVAEAPAAEPKQVALTVRAEPGVPSSFGEVGISGLESVGEGVVRRELTFQPGDLFRESDVIKSQRRLVELGLFEFAHVAPALNDQPLRQVPMRVTLTEGPPRELRLSGGYGSEERLRGEARWSHLNFLGGARRMTAETKWSSIDRGAKFLFTQPYFLHRGLSLNVSGTAWRTSHLTYSTSTLGGRAMVAWHGDPTAGALGDNVHYEVRAGYVNEYLEYGITADSLGDLSQRQERIALGLDPDSGRGAGTLAALDLDLERIAVDDPLNPASGTIATLHLMNATRFLQGSFQYREVLGEVRAYLPIGESIVWANRGRAGALFARSVDDMPFSARFFLGGSTSVRGWGRFEISPLNAQGLPIGGRSLVEVSSELRFPVRGKLHGVVFADAGGVGADSRLPFGGLRYAVGPGLRYLTPIGPVRVDFGVQLNPIPGLVIEGMPEERRWRLHFSIGQAF
jgi:outer membrane protein insertion porin family